MFMRTDIIFFFVKHLVCVRRSRLFNRVYRWQYFVFYLYQFLCFFRCFSVLRSNQCNRISKIMCKATDRNQRILIMFQMSDLVLSRYIFSSHNSFYTIKCSGFGRINGKYSGTRIFTSKCYSIKHSIKIKIIRVSACSKHFFLYVDPRHTVSDCPVLVSVIRKYSCIQNLCCKPNRIYDLYITGTAAVVISQGISDFIIGRCFIYIQKRLCAHHHSRDAEATLYSPRLSVCISINLFFPFRQTFHRDHFPAFQQICIRDTCLAGLSVNDHSAGSTCPFTTSILH